MRLHTAQHQLHDKVGYAVLYIDFNGPNKHAVISLHNTLKQAEIMKWSLQNNKLLVSHLAAANEEK